MLRALALDLNSELVKSRKPASIAADLFRPFDKLRAARAAVEGHARRDEMRGPRKIYFVG